MSSFALRLPYSPPSRARTLSTTLISKRVDSKELFSKDTTLALSATFPLYETVNCHQMFLLSRSSLVKFVLSTGNRKNKTEFISQRISAFKNSVQMSVGNKLHTSVKVSRFRFISLEKHKNYHRDDWFVDRKNKFKICGQVLTSSLQLRNRSFPVADWTRTRAKCKTNEKGLCKLCKTTVFHC